MRTLIVLCLCLAAGFTGAEPIAMTKVQKFVTNENGIVKISGVDHGVVSIGTELNISRPAKIKMRMRRTAVSAVNPGHFGVELFGGDDYRAHCYTHDGASFIASLHQGKMKISDNGVRGTKEIFPAQAAASWVDLELYVQPKLAEIHVAGNPRGMVSANLLPLRKFSVYGYHNDVEIKDLSWEPLPVAEAVSTDPLPSFYASFDQGLAGLAARGEIPPSRAEKLERVSGLSGQAVRVAALDKSPTNQPLLEYAVDGLFADHGTVMFWMKSDWDGSYTGDIPVYPMLDGFDAEGRRKLSIAMTWWISFALGRSGSLKSEEMKRDSRSEWYRGDWNHIAMVWSESDWCKAYFNGLPYQQPFGFNGKIFANLDVKSVKRLTVGAGRQSAEAVFDELKIYKRPLSNGEIYDEYRKFMPVDLLLNRTVINAGQADEVVLSVAPGGTCMRPMPAERPLTTGRFDIRVQLADAAGKVVAQKDFAPKLTAPAQLRLPVGCLPAGAYRVRCNVGSARPPFARCLELFGRPRSLGTAQRSFELQAYQPLSPMPPVNDGLTLGKVIFDKDLKDGKILEDGGVKVVASPIGDYLEGGARKMNRFAFEVLFPEKVLDGRPVMLEIEWPDDKPRSMGLYMYPASKGAQHRDRLGGGVQSGHEYPLTGKMQKTRYLFHPGLTSYLFEARAMIGNFPAAVAGFRVFEIENERLPKLAVNAPQGLPARRFGYQDEDETFDQNLGWDYKDKTPQVVTERLLDYMDYTGQNAWQVPFMRYNGYNFPMGGAYHSLYPYRADAYRYMVDALHRRGIITIAGINLYTLPELKMMPYETVDYVRKGWTLSKFSDPPLQPGTGLGPRPNHANPEVRAMMARHVKETAQRFGHVPGVDGISLSTHSFGFYSSLDEGYDDCTVNLFSKETGVAVNAKSGAERREFLTREPQLDRWLSWRAQQSVALFRLIRAEMDKVSPRLKLYVVAGLPNGPSPESTSLLEQLQALKGVYLVQGRNNTSHRHTLHWGSPANHDNEVLYDSAVAVRFMNGKLGFVDNAPTYFESFNGSLKNDVYAGYFQNADVKPFGRYFLKDMAFAVAAMDVQRYLIGAQPLGTWGRDVEAREFAKAFCALPALPFTSVPGVQDPVTVRYLNTPKGTYVYAVSLLWDDCESLLTITSKQPLKDLSTGQVLADAKIALKPFELRSFYAEDSCLKVTAVKTVVPGSVMDDCRAQLDLTQKAIAKLTARKIACDKAEAVLAEMRQRLQRGECAELHRLLFSLAIREARDKAAD